MKITFFTENFQRGGVDTFIAMLINNWPDETDQFTLVCNEDHPGLFDIQKKLHRPCNIVTHGIKTYSGILFKNQSNKLIYLFLRALLPVAKYFYLANAVRALRQILCSGETDRLMVINGGYPAGDSCRAAGIAWGLYSGKPQSIHNFHNLTVPPRYPVLLQENFVDYLLSRYTRSFVTVSKSAKDSMSFRSQIPNEKVTFVHNGLEPAYESGNIFEIRRELGLSPDIPLCLMLGTYEPRKGHNFLLKVFQRVVKHIPKAHLLICGHGNGHEIRFVNNLVENYGLADNVHLMGFRTDAMKILSQADVLLVGSQAFESFGLTCVEAMARSIPVVATDVGGLPEVVENGDGGYCVDQYDFEQFAEHTIRLLSDKDLRTLQGQKGYNRFQRLFTASQMSEKYAELIKNS